jgi:ribokinase
VARFEAVVMHDFYVDRLVNIGSISSLRETLERKRADGGGGIRGVSQYEVRGGNAVNLALALAKLGVKTLLITHSDASHVRMLESAVEDAHAGLRTKAGRAGLTVALEGEVDVMLSDPGGAADFGPELLDEADWDAMRGAAFVCVVNWAANKKGTALLSSVRKGLGRGKRVFLDPADFRDDLHRFMELASLQKEAKLVDWMAMNAQEAAAGVRALGLKAEGVADEAMALAKDMGCEVDVHAETETASSDGTTAASVPCFQGEPRRLTGAGDVWDAASLRCRLKGIDVQERLEFSNAAAWCYVTAERPEPPSLAMVEEALNRLPEHL